MHELLKKDCDSSSIHQVAPSTGNTLSWWTSSGPEMQQSSLSTNLSFKMATFSGPNQHGEQLGFQIHDQDSSSTQSTCQSYPEVASVGERKISGKSLVSKGSGCFGMHGKPEDGQTMSTLSSQDYVLSSSYVDHRQSVGNISFTYPDTQSSGFVPAYGVHPMIHSQMICMAPNRVPLPLDLPRDEPIYVNAKQYRAILRRRQYRAKLEAQSKLAKNRKPYLHESRHRHALNRARGPGGRFLNVKKHLDSNITAQADGRENSGSRQSHLTSKVWESEVHQLENYEEGDPATSSSDITSASTIDSIFPQQELGFSVYGSHIGGIQHYLSVSQ